MAKRFIKITQTFTCTAIMDIEDGESPESIMNRIKTHCKNAGGEDVVINQGGQIGYELCSDRPTTNDEETYECID